MIWITYKTKCKIAGINLTIFIITLNLNELNKSKVRYYQIELKKQNWTICYLQETHFKFNDTDRLKIKRWKRCTMQATIIRQMN